MGRMEWLWSALALGAVTATGFLLNQLFWEPRARARDAHEQNVRALRNLQALLAESLEAFRDQNFKAQKLLQSIMEKHPEISLTDANGKSRGYDAVFHDAYRVLTPDEMELFQLIRGATLTTMHDVNSRMKRWLDDQPEFVGPQSNPARAQLRKKLVELQVHLNRWLEKYAGWMKDEARTLVYLGDEKGHGPEFPEGIDDAVTDALRALNHGA